MSYDKAKEHLEEIRTILVKPANDREEMVWNLSLALSELIEALESDLSDIRRLLNRPSQDRGRP